MLVLLEESRPWRLQPARTRAQRPPLTGEVAPMPPTSCNFLFKGALLFSLWQVVMQSRTSCPFRER